MLICALVKTAVAAVVWSSLRPHQLDASKFWARCSWRQQSISVVVDRGCKRARVLKRRRRVDVGERRFCVAGVVVAVDADKLPLVVGIHASARSLASRVELTTTTSLQVGLCRQASLVGRSAGGDGVEASARSLACRRGRALRTPAARDDERRRRHETRARARCSLKRASSRLARSFDARRRSSLTGSATRRSSTSSSYSSSCSTLRGRQIVTCRRAF